MAGMEQKIRLTAVDQTREAFNSVQGNITGLTSSLKRLAGPLATVFAGFTTVGAITQTAAYSKEIERFSQVAGISVERFQEMAFASERVGISQEKLGDILKDVTDRVGDFVQTGGGPMADFFERIAPQVGVTAEQFRRLNGADALQLYVSSLEKANVNQNDMNFYMEAIASEASHLVPLLRNNGEAFAELAKEAQALGIVLDEKAIKQGREFANNLQTLKTLSTSFGQSIANILIPSLNEIANTFLAINKVSKDEGGLLMTLLKLTEFAELFGVGVTEKVVKAKEEIVTSTKAINDALAGTSENVNEDRGRVSALKELNEVIEIQKEKAKQLRDIYEKTLSPVDRLNNELQMADEAFRTLGISQEQYMTLIEQANQKYDSSIEKTAVAKTGLQQYADAARNLGSQLDNVAVRSLQGLEDALTGVFMGTMTVKDAFKSMASSIISDLIRIYIQRTITGPIADALFGPLQTASVSARAMGGPVSVNRPYMVGEKGPELFVPNSSGSIVANNKLAGGGGDTVVVNQTINLSAGVSQTVRAEVMNMMPKIMEATKGAVADAKRRGGTFAKAFA